MRTTRRAALKGALAAPALAAAPRLGAAGPSVVIYDPALSAPPTAGAVPIEGDRIRFAQTLFRRRPALVVGVSRHADALLIADVGREAGYRPVNQSLDRDHGWALALG